MKVTSCFGILALPIFLAAADPGRASPEETGFDSTAAWIGPIEDTRGVALGDVDGDGDLDLVRANDDRGATLYLNTGGSFAPSPAWTGPPERAVSLALGDVDGDGDLDLVQGTFFGGATLHLNIGGVFSSARTWLGPVEAITRSVALGDVDGDGDLDLVRGNDYYATTLYLNTGGTFSSAPDWTGPMEATYSVALGDVDGDGDLDLVRGNYEQSATLYRNAHGTFSMTPDWSGPAESTVSVSLTDVDGDGDVDLLRGNYAQGSTLYRNTDGQFTMPAAWESPPERTTSIALGDVDGDGDPDLVQGNYRRGSTLYLNTAGQFSASPAWTGLPHFTLDVALGDVDGDGDLDLAQADDAHRALLFLNMGTLLFTGTAWTGPAEATYSVALGDVDGDGDLDLVRANFFRGATLYRNTDGNFPAAPDWTGPAEATVSVALGDVDGDGDLDLVRGNYYGGATLYRNIGGTFASAPDWTGPVEATYDVALEDMDGDGDLDLVRGNNGQGATLYANIGGLFSLTPAWTGPAEFTRDIALGDVDGDGDFDLVRGNINEGATLYLNSGGGLPSAPAWTGPAETTFSVALGDVDGDGDLDLVCGNEHQGATLYLNSGGLFSPAPVWTGPVATNYGLALGDADGDGDLDLIQGNYGRGATLHLNTGRGFSSTAAWTGPAETTFGIAVGDVDEDGDLDLVRANFQENVTLYKGRSSEPLPGVPHFRSIRVTSTPGKTRIAFTALDDRSGPLKLTGHYQFEGQPVWRPIVFEGFPSPLAGPWTASPSGIEHEVWWDTREVPSDPRNVVLRLRAIPTFMNAGLLPTVTYRTRIGPLNLTVSSLVQADARGEYPAGEKAQVAVSLPPWARYLTGQVYFRPGGSTDYDSTALRVAEVLPGTFGPIGTIPGTAIGARGLEYWVQVRTPTRSASDPPFEPAQSPLFLRTNVTRLEEDSLHAGRLYRMVSLPLDLDLPPAASLAAVLLDEPDFGAYDPQKWRAFRYSPGDSAYREVVEASTDGFLRPEPGRAFWLSAATANRVDTAPVPGRSVPTNAAYPVTLLPGWNQIGCPFDFPVAWRDVTWDGPMESVEPPVGWNEMEQRYETGDAGVLLPFSGYWVMNRAGVPVTLRIPPDEAAGRAAPLTAHGERSEEHEWSIQIIAASGPEIDAGNFAGIAADGRPGLDRLDRSDPPAAPVSGLSLYFLSDEPGQPRLTRDIRPPLADSGDPAIRGERWPFGVAVGGETAPSREIALTFSGMDQVPDDLAIRLVDHELKRSVDLRRQPRYSSVWISPPSRTGPGDAPFDLLIGTAAYVEALLAGLPEVSPLVTRLLPNRPNPFASRTLVRFEIARPGPAQVSVFDVAGRLLRTLVDDFRDAGVHEVAWPGDDDQGQPVAPGVYFIRFTAQGEAGVRKVVRVR